MEERNKERKDERKRNGRRERKKLEGCHSLCTKLNSK